MRGSSLFTMAPAAALLFALAGCGSDAGTVTGDYFEQQAGDLSVSSVSVDSVANFAATISSPSYALAGNYNGATAFTVLKFARLTSSQKASLDRAQLTLTVSGNWMAGTHEFAIYAADNINWSDTVRVDEGDFTINGSAIGTFSSSDSLSTMTFPLSAEGISTIKSWTSAGTILLKSTNSQSMVNVYTCNSSYSPALQIISDTNADTTNIKPTEMTYGFNGGLSAYTAPGSGRGVVSDGDIRGFVLYTSFPDTVKWTSAINRGKLVIPIERNLIPSNSTISLTLGVLTNKVTSFDDSVNYTDSESYTIHPGDSTLEINLAGVLGSWNANEGSNFGLLFTPSTVTKTPSQVIFSPPSSFSILFTPLAEAK